MKKAPECLQTGSGALFMALDQLSASFSALPGVKRGTLAALILISAPVRGLRPVRAARLPT